MFDNAWSYVSWLLGLELEAKDINVWRMSLRAAVVFILAIAMIRVGDKRFMGRSTALDVMLGIVFGSVVSRAITGNAPFFPTLAAGLVLVIMHWLMSAVAFRSHRFGILVKGTNRLLVRGGELQHEELKRGHISEHDLNEAMRAKGMAPDFRVIESAHLERNGDISIIRRKEPEK
jgi:uncharacterized membrane protein YcaP (DUF421 family)